MKILCSENHDLVVRTVRVRSIWLGDGSYAAVGSFFTGITGNTITHWWVEIETNDPNIWFCAQFDNSQNLCLTKHSNSSGVTNAGVLAGGRLNKNPDITDKEIFSPGTFGRYTTISDVYSWMNNYDSTYNLLTNNCQHFGDAFINRFGRAPRPATILTEQGRAVGVAIDFMVNWNRHVFPQASNEQSRVVQEGCRLQ